MPEVAFIIMPTMLVLPETTNVSAFFPLSSPSGARSYGVTAILFLRTGINTVSLSKTWEQMNIASSFNTTDIWILNVGDLKPLEVPIEFFLSLAYDSSRWPLNSVKEYLRLWATREFGTTYAEEIADLVNSYSVGRLR